MDHMTKARAALLRRALQGGWASWEDVTRVVDLPDAARPTTVTLPLVRAGIITRAGSVASARRTRPARRVPCWAVTDHAKAEAWLASH